jgi:hypothetical protein
VRETGSHDRGKRGDDCQHVIPPFPCRLCVRQTGQHPV